MANSFPSLEALVTTPKAPLKKSFIHPQEQLVRSCCGAQPRRNNLLITVKTVITPYRPRTGPKEYFVSTSSSIISGLTSVSLPKNSYFRIFEFIIFEAVFLSFTSVQKKIVKNLGTRFLTKLLRAVSPASTFSLETLAFRER